jgi:cation diffusion facilitator family transporter
MRAARNYRSVTLAANASHLLTDVLTSIGVIAGVAAVVLTRWQPLDPIIALAVAGQIVYSGFRLVRQSILGLMDTALPADELEMVKRVLAKHSHDGVQFHALRSRQSGARRFVSLHVQVPGAWTVQRGHALLEVIERDVRRAISPVTVFTHIEPVEDPVSWHDITLSREDN